MIRQTTEMLQAKSKPQLVRIISMLYDELEDAQIKLSEVTDAILSRVNKCEAAIKLNLLAMSVSDGTLDTYTQYMLSYIQASLIHILHDIDSDSDIPITDVRNMILSLVKDVMKFMFEAESLDDNEGDDTDEHNNE